jgi:hypothetical protein
MTTRRELHAALDRVLDSGGMEGTAPAATENAVLEQPGLPMMSEAGRKNATQAGKQKRWQRDDRIAISDWDSKYGVHPFGGRR